MLEVDRRVGDGNRKINLSELLAWYNDSDYFTAWLRLQEETPDAEPLSLAFPSGAGPGAIALWACMTPINACLMFTIPDVRRRPPAVRCPEGSGPGDTVTAEVE